ncbi:polyamine aminopropyltransferase, partial [Colwellia sp. BRX8-3]
MHSNLWVEEKFEDFLGIKFKVEKVLFSGKSEFQTVDVVETKGHGKMLLNDGLIMVTERDEFAYHDMISHVPLFVHPHPKNILVIGGGDGGTAREVIRHLSVKKCTMVEIDEMVVDACKKHIPQTASALDDERIDLIIGDGVQFVKETTEKFDVIIVDSTDPIGPAQPLFGEAFYKDVFNCLADDGIVVAQGESS